MAKQIGLSLSSCVCDICEGVVALENVEKIVAGTRAVTKEDWKRLLDEYCEIYWSGYQFQAR